MLPLRRTVERICEHAACGRPFAARERDIKRGWGRFCSPACANVIKGQLWAEKYPQAGALNQNFKGWASKRPIVYVRRYRLNNPEKVRAQQLMTAAIARGELVRPEACQRCGKRRGLRRLDGHHADYSRPLDVVFVCRRCHVVLDRQRRAATSHGPAVVQVASASLSAQ